LFASVLHLEAWHPSKRAAARQAAMMVDNEVRAIEREMWSE
jgi:hypothetical protein